MAHFALTVEYTYLSSLWKKGVWMVDFAIPFAFFFGRFALIESKLNTHGVIIYPQHPLGF
jgi:hypothetical protein